MRGFCVVIVVLECVKCVFLMAVANNGKYGDATAYQCPKKKRNNQPQPCDAI